MSTQLENPQIIFLLLNHGGKSDVGKNYSTMIEFDMIYMARFNLAFHFGAL